MRSILTTKGYTLIEAILQLSVLLLFSQLILFYAVWFSQIEKHFFNSELIDWEMFSLDMESIVSDVTHIEEQMNQTGIRFLKDGVEYDIECYPSLIRKQKNRLGHEPMLTEVKLCKIQVLDDQVLIYVEFENGRKEERTYEVFVSS
ncbi:competence type IV pilus minor pilin ComGF [Paenisporosarcina sp. TG20]|uniref:competence type IV pilus minor pilin ComGF n=1 Tax=Paenisporosarcina sp. TG20 TaxID=1211706 RepID=UPI0002DF8724|nr:competence type IV pilus minor pilin ComGF [Paenisporosarcina sp. TG20]